MGSRRRIFGLRSGALAAVLAAVVFAGCGGDNGQETEKPAPFGYSGKDGPSHWGSLDPSYGLCSEGRKQSPIDLTHAQPSALPRIHFAYEPAEVEVENNGHSLEVVYPPGSSIQLDGTEYELKQFHYHAPSEHEVNGHSLPMEFHFVNESDDGAVAVIGVLVEKGQPNPAVSKLVRALPKEEGETLPVSGELNPLDLLPPDPVSAARWSYEGSFTTPPCTEGVRWSVFKRPIELSAPQIAAFIGVYDHNNRPVQPLNGRELLVSR